MENLQVVTVVFNPIRWKSRDELFREFVQHMADLRVELFIVECAFGKRDFLYTDPENPYHVQVRAFDEVWVKECLIRIGVSRTTSPFVCWTDADIHYADRDWAAKTVHALQHYKFVQPWSTSVYLDSAGRAMTRHHSFCYDWVNQMSGIYKPKREGYMIGPDFNWHPGLSWAARREVIDQLGGLIEFDILGSADLIMTQCLIERWPDPVDMWGGPKPEHLTPGYHAEVMAWQDRCKRYVERDIGYVDGTVLHRWHGPIGNRFYEHKWEIYKRNGYDPRTHLQRNSHGVIQLSDKAGPHFRDDLRSYMRVRNEDALT